ncbi:DM13 domain-containing protein [Bacillus kexueae]|uniref:DM13 domain-containing protein n=1 Tax=Aeribacillus kexueae TaxID=2078952 RepID=UPI001FAE7ACB|nr:DM13 domain-containing protein [Bacillus kexueae]
MKKVFFVLIGLLILSVGWYLVSPLFFDDVVDEEPLHQELTENVTESEVSPSEDANEEEPHEPPLMGEFVGVDEIHHAEGIVTYYEKEQYIRFEQFESTNGPDLYVYLVKGEQKTSEGISLGKLKGNVGNQNYEIASDILIEPGDKIVIWCKQFDVDFGYATLQQESL